jgi:transposase-like protein
MAKASRWTAKKHSSIVKEALSQKIPGGQIDRRHQISEGVIYRWRDRLREDGKGVLAFAGHSGSGTQKAALERQVEDLQKLIGEQSAESVF